MKVDSELEYNIVRACYAIKEWLYFEFKIHFPRLSTCKATSGVVIDLK